MNLFHLGHVFTKIYNLQIKHENIFNSHLFHVNIVLNQPIGRVFANVPGDPDSIPGQVIAKTQK